MEKVLKRICIICIVILVLLVIYSIYKDYILPKMYDSESIGKKVTDEAEYNICNNAAFKYFDSMRSNINNIKYFMPSVNRNKAKTSVYAENLKDYYQLKTYDIYKLAKNVYRVEYKVFYGDKERYSMVIKLNKGRNYYTVLYDQLYKEGKVG